MNTTKNASSVGQLAPAGSDKFHDHIDREWIDYKDTKLPPPDLSAIYAEADGVMLRVRGIQSATQGGSPDQAMVVPPTPGIGHTQAHMQSLGWPPGKAGEIAKLIYNSSMRPVAEVSIVATLGLLAGVCGRSWNIPKSGLNVYIVLLARSGIGKEAMSEAISMFIQGAAKYRQGVAAHFSFNDYASGPALTKAVASTPCFTHIAGEFGRKLKAMSNSKDSAMQSLRSVMTRLYAKSSFNAIAGGIDYSNQENSVASVTGAAYSMIGDSTPGTFRESLTPDMMEDGFLSRFTVVEYTGQRPPRNPNHFTGLPDVWASWFATLVTQAQLLASKGAPLLVQSDAQATDLLDQFELECDKNINSTDDEAFRQMWNRAALKALRIAALLAVADNHTCPRVRIEHAGWAIDLIRRDIALFSERLRSGDIGGGSEACERKLMAIIREYVAEQPSPGYKIPPRMQEGGVFPRSYLQRRTASLPAFKNHKSGSATVALDQALRSLADSGYIKEVNKETLIEEYREFGRAFRVLNFS